MASSRTHGDLAALCAGHPAGKTWRHSVPRQESVQSIFVTRTHDRAYTCVAVSGEMARAAVFNRGVGERSLGQAIPVGIHKGETVFDAMKQRRGHPLFHRAADSQMGQ